MSPVRSFARLVAPGIGVKRWLLLAAASLFIAALGLTLIRLGGSLDLLAYPASLADRLYSSLPVLAQHPWVSVVSGIVVLALGVVLFFYSLSRLAAGLGGTPQNRSVGGWMATMLRSRQLAQGPRVVAIGGGTGLSTMLRGLKHHTSNIVAVVTVTDDGGSSGRLVRQLNIPPPGDIRNCLVALADEEGVMTQLLQHRFQGSDPKDGLRNHAVGNLLIAALTEICDGDFQKAVRLTSTVLNIRGEVWPSTFERVSLAAEMEDGSIIEGETNIAHSPLRIRKVMLKPSNASAPDEVIQAIMDADLIVIGPGSVYTSVIPNLLVHGIPQALERTYATKVYVCNVMTQPGESDGFSAFDHLLAIQAHLARPVIDWVVVNTATPTPALLERYRQSDAELVTPDLDRFRALNARPLTGNFISETDVVRHDSAKLAEAIMSLLR